jgi:hypothetical protein
MDSVPYLNIEYIILRAYEILFQVPGVTNAVSETQAPASDIVHQVAILLGEIALLGMAVTVILFVLTVWVRIRMTIVEHVGFDKKDTVEHLRPDTAEVVPEVKNPRWARVFELANTPNENDWRLAIIEADIMLGDVLKERGYRGDSVGERLRDANPLNMSTLDLAWQAHKVRNDIAHAGEGYHLSQREANATIDLYRRVFEELKYI